MKTATIIHVEDVVSVLDIIISSHVRGHLKSSRFDPKRKKFNMGEGVFTVFIL